MGAFVIGLIIAPRKVYAAFLRGRHSSNLYRRTFDDALLSKEVGTLRRELNLINERPQASALDVMAFLVWSFSSFVAITSPGLAALTLTIYGLVWLWR